MSAFDPDPPLPPPYLDSLNLDTPPELPPPEYPPVAMPAQSLEDRSSLVNFPHPESMTESLVEEDRAPMLEPTPPPDTTTGFVPVLRNHNFLVLWLGQTFSQLADKVYLVLMVAIIDTCFQSENQAISGWVTAIMVTFTVPAVLFGSLAGVYVDRWLKKPVLVTTNLLRGSLVLFIPLSLWLAQDVYFSQGLPLGFAFLLAITFLVSTLTQFFAPAEQAVIPLIVERRHLLSANSLYTTTMMASVIIGFAVGDPLLKLADLFTQGLGGRVGLGKELAVGCGYLIAGGLLLLLRTGEKRQALARESPHPWQDIREGLQLLQERHHVRAAMVQLVILSSVFASLAVLAVLLAEVMPEIATSQFGFLLAAGGVGMALGAVVIGHIGQQFPRFQMGLLGSIGMGIALAVLSLFTHQFWPAMVLITLLGICAALIGVPMQTTIQAETPEALRGKVFGLQNNAVNIALTLPLALTGLLAERLGLPSIFLGLSVLALSGGLSTWYIARKRPNS